ncbi:related to BRX1 - Essential nucleolar protein required for biogenesis of the 60S ribosomal subunit [Melanopsichium pennsylvanicum]|uniref:Related to BRX1 - Essential nucleolar protein required for biogenesis of the 60S ribosomal subunit n=2 Tax=Melanopsichium pennsylvanicum TaxID=63383 RepID=A0AAJ4XLZ6_9BASI|nr:related to BRX1-Essential nucleolar protein required for biogenesis of the 60S ribosomal subunit [Melanopsichium pennsylvanicum 4]SNX84727.1 related to BRX1 - Essential nucleolar protein required for biogenesis of the 60S ribosomal subunit [Melanopsichium pennsylvanicum]
MASVFQQASKASKGKRKADAADDDSSANNNVVPIRRNKQRVLMLPSRGVTSRMRHLINDLESLMPHAKKDSKLDSKSQLHLLNELAELHNCNNTLYFEARKREDLYMWASKSPNGPSAKFQVQNIHTMDELKMTGNCLKGSRPILSFDKEFDEKPHWTLIKEMFTQMFGVPKGARKSKPFVDHVISFSIVDNKVWFRNYQIVETDPGATAMAKVDEDKDAKKKASHSAKGEAKQPKLVEIGPRMVLSPIRVFEGSFGGATVFENPEYISPNAIRHMIRKKKGDKYADRVNQNETFKTKKDRLKPQEDALSRKRVFA